MHHVVVSVQFSCSVMSDSLRPHGLQHARLPCPSPIPGAYSNSCPLSQWCHPTISSSVVPFSSCLQPSPASGSLKWISSLQQVAKVLRVSAAASVFPMTIQDWFPLRSKVGSPCCPRDSQESSTPQFKSTVLWHSDIFIVQLSHPYVMTRKTIAFTRWTFVGKIMSLLFNMLSSLVITFLPRSKCLLISWVQSPSAVILEPPKKSLSLFPLFPHLFAMKWWDQMPWS